MFCSRIILHPKSEKKLKNYFLNEFDVSTRYSIINVTMIQSKFDWKILLLAFNLWMRFYGCFVQSFSSFKWYSIISDDNNKRETCISSFHRQIPIQGKILYSSIHDGAEEEGMHTYVEGLEYTSWESEILAMGGDPAFMDVDVLQEENQVSDTTEMDTSYPSFTFMESLETIQDSANWAPLRGLGPRPEPKKTMHEIVVGNKVEWDGTIDEDAYFDD